ncbi:hypothetical protein DAI22_02g202500 [Oryza sativa Japonica Group]|nr:hypothetical protein DAI22_02g202500 [Oryza sativa Japonica Group]
MGSYVRIRSPRARGPDEARPAHHQPVPSSDTKSSQRRTPPDPRRQRREGREAHSLPARAPPPTYTLRLHRLPPSHSSPPPPLHPPTNPPHAAIPRS